MELRALIPLQETVVQMDDAFDANGYVTIRMPDATEAGLNKYDLTVLYHHIGKLLGRNK